MLSNIAATWTAAGPQDRQALPVMSKAATSLASTSPGNCCCSLLRQLSSSDSSAGALLLSVTHSSRPGSCCSAAHWMDCTAAMASPAPTELWLGLSVRYCRTPASILLNAVSAHMLLGSQAAVPSARAPAGETPGKHAQQANWLWWC
jgi:hypothetical protein